MWRNRQTRRIQVPVVVNTLWVQVPSSAPNKKDAIRRLFYLVLYFNEGGNPDGFPLKLLFPSDRNYFFRFFALNKPDKINRRHTASFLFGALF